MVKMKKQPIEWITVNGNHVPIFEGQSKKDAISSFIKDKSPMEKNKSLFSGAGSERGSFTDKERTRFINIQLFAYSYKNMTVKQIEKSIKNNKKEIIKHKMYIESPQEYVGNWDNYSDKEKKGLIKWWQKEINNFETQIKNAEEELDGRKD